MLFFALKLFFFLFLRLFLILEWYNKVLYLVNFCDKLVDPSAISFLRRMIIRLSVVFALTLCTLISVALSARRHYELFLLVQFLGSLIRRLSINHLSSTTGIAFDLGERFSDMTGDFGLIDTKHESVEDCWREIIVVDLLTLVRRL